MSLVTEAGGTFGGAHSSVGRGVPSAQAVFSAAMNLSRTALGGIDGAAKRWPADRAPRFEKFSDLRDSSYTCMQPASRVAASSGSGRGGAHGVTCWPALLASADLLSVLAIF